MDKKGPQLLGSIYKAMYGCKDDKRCGQDDCEFVSGLAAPYGLRHPCYVSADATWEQERRILFQTVPITTSSSRSTLVLVVIMAERWVP